jgi:hypothetical protein
MPKIFSYSKSNNSSLLLIKSDHPKYTYEVYWKNGIFAGYMGNREIELIKERKEINQQ